MKHWIDQLEQNKVLPLSAMISLLGESGDTGVSAYLFQRAAAIRSRYYGDTVFMRGLIEFTSYCKNDCFYCGLRKSNQTAQRYRLTLEEILECCETGYALGFRTFVLQGGEDAYWTDRRMAAVISAIREKYPDCAITLSLGEKSKESLALFQKAGANRYLLRFETSDPAHYESLHPAPLSLESRLRCLWDLKALGYQVGTGFMVGLPGQTDAHLAKDLQLIAELQPEMVGIGPFLPHHATPLAKAPPGTTEKTLFIVGLIRLMLPSVLLPATTALATLDPLGREKGMQAGGNVVMPNLSPKSVRAKYLLYDNKVCTGDEAAECRVCMEKRMQSAGFRLVVDRGDFFPAQTTNENEVHFDV